MKKCVIVVDYQQDFVTGSLGFAGAEALDGRIAARIADYRAEGGDVLFTMDTHRTASKGRRATPFMALSGKRKKTATVLSARGHSGRMSCTLFCAKIPMARLSLPA